MERWNMIDKLSKLQAGERISLMSNRGVFVREDQIFNGSQEITFDQLQNIDDLRIIILENAEPDLRKKIESLGILVINEISARHKLRDLDRYVTS